VVIYSKKATMNIFEVLGCLSVCLCASSGAVLIAL